MTDEEATDILQQIIDDYQEDASFAHLSGQIDKYFLDTYKVEVQNISELVEAIGQAISMDIAEQIAHENFNVPEDEAHAWVHDHLSHEAIHMMSAAGNQVAIHAFCIGYLFAKKTIQEEAHVG